RFDGMLPLVLRIRRAPIEAADQANDVGVRAWNLELLERALAEIEYFALELFLDRRDFGPRFVGTQGRLGKTVDGAACDLATEGALAVEANGAAVGGELELDVGNLLDHGQMGVGLADDALERFGGDWHRREQPLGEVVALVALDGDTHHAFRFA